jgi:tetratricopeptide (TPR) repeat protein
MTRLEQLQQFLAEDPSDPFNHYALALEYLKSDIQAAAAHFDRLLTTYPDYLPTYYHAAALFEKMGDGKKAVATLESGIAKARVQNQVKAQRELQGMYDELMDE